MRAAACEGLPRKCGDVDSELMVTSMSAVVLAGGRSMRMGRPKALLECDGQPMWRRQRDVVAAAGATEIFLSARPEHEWAYAADGFAALLHDAYPDCGPISGVTAGLERMSHGHLAVLAIDLPKMAPDWFRGLASLCSAGVGAVGRHGEFFEPLAAIYPAEMKWLAWETFARGEYALQPLIEEAVKRGLLQARAITAAEAPWFENWNEPEM